MKTIVIINGANGVGKDTFVKFCAKYASVKNISSIDPAKYASQYLVGSKGHFEQKTDEFRKLLKELKEISVAYNNYPFTYICEKIETFVNGTADVMFVHIREIPEIEKILRYVKRNYEGILKCLTFGMIKTSDMEASYKTCKLGEYQYNYILINDGDLNSLEEKAHTFINNVIKVDEYINKASSVIKLIKGMYREGGIKMNECKLKMSLKEIVERFGTDDLETCTRCENFTVIDGMFTCKILENLIKGE